MTISRRRLLQAAPLALTALSLSLPWAGACAASHEPLPPKGTWPLTFTDLAGRRVTVEKTPKTFIVANYIANFLCVGGGASIPKVVGLTQDGWPETRSGEYRVFGKAFPELPKLPSIGGYHDDILNSEKILAIRPDVLLIGRSQAAANGARIAVFEKAGIRVVTLDYHAMQVENHLHSTRILGRLLGRDDVADSQCREYEACLRMVADRVAKTDARPSAYVELGNMGLGAYGNSYNNTVLWGAMLTAAGARNIAGSMKTPYGPLDREFVLANNPEHIFLAGSIWENRHGADQMRMGFMVTREEAAQRLKAFRNRPLWNRLKAVQENRLYGVDHGSLRCMMDCWFTVFLAQCLHPELFADQNPEEQMKAFYAKYLPEIDPQGTFTLKL